MTNIIASAVHGIILGCARCHDHKFDPFRRKDYYRMQGIFKGTNEGFALARQWRANRL